MGRAENRKAVAAYKRANPGLRAGTKRPRPLSGEALDQAKEAAEAQQAAAQARAVAQADMLRKVVNGIPAELRDTPEAKLMLSRLQASWDAPVHPKEAQRYAAEWQEFLARTRAGRLQHAAGAGLWVPGMPR